MAAVAQATSFLLAALPGHVSASDVTVPVATVQEIGGCSNALPWSKRSEVRAVERDGAQLVVTVFANAACGGLRPDSPQVEISGNAVALSWIWTNPDNAPMAACLCTRHLKFIVGGAPAGDVVVTAAERPR